MRASGDVARYLVEMRLHGICVGECVSANESANAVPLPGAGQMAPKRQAFSLHPAHRRAPLVEIRANSGRNFKN
jgi:hypothetical protein